MIFTIEWSQSDKNVREIFWAIHVMIFTFYFGWAGLNISNIIQPFMINFGFKQEKRFEQGSQFQILAIDIQLIALA